MNFGHNFDFFTIRIALFSIGPFPTMFENGPGSPGMGSAEFCSNVQSDGQRDLLNNNLDELAVDSYK